MFHQVNLSNKNVSSTAFVPKSSVSNVATLRLNIKSIVSDVLSQYLDRCALSSKQDPSYSTEESLMC